MGIHQHAAGRRVPEIEHTDGSRQAADRWTLAARRARRQIDLRPLRGTTLDRSGLGTGPSLTVALAERGIPASASTSRRTPLTSSRSSEPWSCCATCRPCPGDRPLDHGAAGGREHRDRRRPAALFSRVAERLAPQGRARSNSSRPALRFAASRSGCATPHSASAWFPWPTSARIISPTVAYDAVRPGRHLDASTDGGSPPSARPGLCRTNPRHAVTESYTNGPRMNPSVQIDGNFSHYERKATGGRDRPGPVGDGGPGTCCSWPARPRPGAATLAAAADRRVDRDRSPPPGCCGRSRGGPLSHLSCLAASPSSWSRCSRRRGAAAISTATSGTAGRAAGVDPYEYVPTATPLVRLRDESRSTLPPRTASRRIRPPARRRLTPGCSRLTRPSVPTIYPPVAEAYFLAVDSCRPPGLGHAHAGHDGARSPCSSRGCC